MTNTSKDINDVFDEIFLNEEQEGQASYDEGFQKGVQSANIEGYHLGYHRGAELGAELGYYFGTIHRHLSLHQQSGNSLYTEKITKQLEKVRQLISSFPRTNSELVDILALAETIRANYKKLCALLKVDSTHPFVDDISF